MWFFFFFKQKTADEMRISDLSSDVCSSDLGPHAHLKRRLDQALRRRGSRDFVSIEAWREFVEAQVARQNRRHAARIDAERRVLKALPARRTTDFAMVTVDVTRNGTVRSEESRVGKECVRTCRSRWAPCH